MLQKIILFIFFIFVIFALAYKFFITPRPPQQTIVILQSIDHETLNSVRTALSEKVKSEFPNVVIVYENAHGNMAMMQQIAQKFSSMNPTLMVGMGTQASQSLLPFSQERNTPLVFTAVTDPVAAKLTSHPLVTGVSDFMKALPQLEFFKTLLPHLKKLGVLYNPGEVNSVTYMEFVKQAANESGIELIMSPIQSTNDAKAATERLVSKVDAIYFPNDNTAMASVGSIVLTAQKYGIPVFANDSASVKKGATAALAYDRWQMGIDTGEIIIKILKGQKPESIPIKSDGKMEPITNLKAHKST